jgi:hypothetical protein
MSAIEASASLTFCESFSASLTGAAARSSDELTRDCSAVRYAAASFCGLTSMWATASRTCSPQLAAVYFEQKTTRDEIIETMREYNEFFRFTPHAYFVSYVVHIAAMFDRAKDTISLTRLAREMKAARFIQGQEAAEVDALLDEAAPIAAKVIILRHGAFAHRSASISYDDVFKFAAVKPDQLRDLTEVALKITNRLLLARGLRTSASPRCPKTPPKR